MPLKTILFILLFVVSCGGALWAPVLGVMGYVLHYSVGPERQWWEAPISSLGIRYSFTLAIMTAIGLALNFRNMRWGKKLLTRHEILLLLFLALVWVVTMLTAPTVGRYTIVDHPSVKLAKVVIFLLMLTHIVTTQRKLQALMWILVIGTLILGLQAYTLPRSAFESGRLETVGGPDFAESNVLPAYLVAVLPIIGVQFFRAGWLGKGLCLVSGAFAANAIVLTRSRGALVGIAAAVVAAVAFSPRRLRLKIIAGVIAALAGFLYLTDEQFRKRSLTVFAEERERDQSTVSRFEIWRGSVDMAMDHPLGVGVGNFYQTIGDYRPEHAGRDAHNTYLRCWTELGFAGIGLLLLICVSAGRILLRCIKQAQALPPPVSEWGVYTSYGLLVGLAGALGGALTISITYVEFFWWMLVLPVCAERALNNLSEDVRATSSAEDHAQPPRAAPTRARATPSAGI